MINVKMIMNMNVIGLWEIKEKNSLVLNQQNSVALLLCSVICVTVQAG